MSGIAALCLLSVGVMMTEVAILIIVIVLVHTIVDTIFVTVFINPKKSLMIMNGFYKQQVFYIITYNFDAEDVKMTSINLHNTCGRSSV